MTLLTDLELNRIAVHEVLLRDEDLTPKPPRCSETLAQLDADGISTIRLRLSKALGSNTKSVEMEVRDHDAGSCFHLCGCLIDADDETFLAHSKTLAQKLASAQTSRAIPGGIFVVMDGTVGRDRHKCAIVIKAEVSSGFVKEDGQHGPSLRFLADLLLTPQQRLQKIGIFIRNGDNSGGEEHDPDDYLVYVFDSLMSGSEITTAANYFYEGFLGCTAASTARKLTRDFYNHTRTFLEAAPVDDEKKVEYVTALHAYLRAPGELIHATEFANTYIQPDLHQDYADALTDAGVPARAITKDTTSIRSRLRLRRLDFTGNVRITAPATEFARLVEVESTENNATRVLIRGRLERQE